jgi:UDP-N-acetylmuramoyl-L-alanyl-D-glutamate--2,6-diaminopimelate ligase
VQLSDLVGGEWTGANKGVAGEIDIAGIAAHSTDVRPGFLFAALKGVKSDGSRHVADAVRRGAVAVLVNRGVRVDAGGARVVAVADARRTLAIAAARFFGTQPATVVAVTGTNGKTSVVNFVRQMWKAAGLHASSLGTLGVTSGARHTPLKHTTPDPIELHRLLAELAGDGVDHLALEASSHGLDQHRLAGVRLTAAAFTNLSRDHLDYHATTEAYFAAKQSLFGAVLPRGGVAVLNADAPEYPQLVATCRARDHRVISYGRAGHDLRVAGFRPNGSGTYVELEHDGRTETVRVPLVGDFQLWNALCALGLVIGAGGAADAALRAITTLKGVPGRMQQVAEINEARIFIDYAHTPDAIEKVLRTLRPYARGRLAIVFGCGGDRDPGKRPVMGSIACELADRVIVTDDNPRTEDAARIRAQVLAGCTRATEIGDRSEAIRTAIAGLDEGDVLVVAGKGHESGQIVGTRTLPFDDAEQVRAAVRDAAGAAP